MMKNVKINKLGAIAMLLALVACQREDVNPNYDPETKTVTAQFVLSVATNEPTATKMSADVVQMNSNFRGIQDAKIISFATQGKGFVSDPTGSQYKQDYSFSDLLAKDVVSIAAGHSRRILELNLNTGTDAVLVYGKAKNSNPGIETGSSSATIDAKVPANTHFDAVKRLSEDKVTSYDQTAALMILCINYIIASNVTANDTYPALSWSYLGQQYELANDNRYGYTIAPVQLNALETILGQVYADLTYIKVQGEGTQQQINQGSEYRAGSSLAVKKWMTDAFTVISKVRDAVPTDDREANAKRLATQIETNMNKFFTGGWEYKGKEEIQVALNGITFDVVTNSGTTSVTFNETTFPANFGQALDLNDFPREFNIPVGAAQLAFNKTTQRFSYKHPNAPLVNPNANGFDPLKYLYPVELFYYVNSPIRTTSYGSLSNDNFPDGQTNWDTATSWNAWSEAGCTWTPKGTVSSSTRGVAVQYNLNYGVAMLESKVEYATEGGSAITSFEDNRKEVTGDATNQTITNLDLTLRGILVGGQIPQVDWQFLRKDTTKPFDNVIYDNAPASTVVPTPAATPNYTLVFDNYDSGGTQQDVYVALEFVNNGDAFYGRDNIIPKTGVFYLLGKLEASPAGQTITWPSASINQIPPLYGVGGEAVPGGETAGQSKQIPRVFIQDFVTRATFRIGKTSLQKAYLTIPDLRAAQMSLGLSVDLTWQNGYLYDIEL